MIRPWLSRAATVERGGTVDLLVAVLWFEGECLDFELEDDKGVDDDEERVRGERWPPFCGAAPKANDSRTISTIGAILRMVSAPNSFWRG